MRRNTPKTYHLPAGAFKPGALARSSMPVVNPESGSGEGIAPTEYEPEAQCCIPPGGFTAPVDSPPEPRKRGRPKGSVAYRKRARLQAAAKPPYSAENYQWPAGLENEPFIAVTDFLKSKKFCSRAHLWLLVKLGKVKLKRSLSKPFVDMRSWYAHLTDDPKS